MWIPVIGAAGTCKQAIVDDVVAKESFTVIAPDYDERGKHVLLNEINTLTARYRSCVAIAKMFEEKDILTIRSFWDSVVYIEALFRAHMIGREDYAIYKRVYETLAKSAPPPHGVIYLRPKNQVQAHARASLQSKPITEEFEGHLVEAYDEHIAKVCVPKIEIEVSDIFSRMCEEVISGINSFRASQIGGASIWKRNYYR